MFISKTIQKKRSYVIPASGAANLSPQIYTHHSRHVWKPRKFMTETCWHFKPCMYGVAGTNNVSLLYVSGNFELINEL